MIENSGVIFPLYDKGDAMASLVGIRFVAAPVMAEVDVFLFELGEVAFG